MDHWNIIQLCRACHRLQHLKGWPEFASNNNAVLQELKSKGWEIVTVMGQRRLTRI